MRENELNVRLLHPPVLSELRHDVSVCEHHSLRQPSCSAGVEQSAHVIRVNEGSGILTGPVIGIHQRHWHTSLTATIQREDFLKNNVESHIHVTHSLYYGLTLIIFVHKLHLLLKIQYTDKPMQTIG